MQTKEKIEYRLPYLQTVWAFSYWLLAVGTCKQAITNSQQLTTNSPFRSVFPDRVLLRIRLTALALLLILLSHTCPSYSQDTLAYWNFDEASGATTRETVSQAAFAIRGKWPVIERVQGIKQNALRSDGYSVWVEGTASTVYPSDKFSVAAWLALETYPVNTAGIWSYLDAATNKGAAVAVDRFGRLVVNFTVNSQLQSFTSTQRIPHYEWSYVTVNIDAQQGTCAAYLNGSEIIKEAFVSGSLNWPNAVTYLGRSAGNEKQDLFPLNFINGIYDEIVVRRSLPAPQAIAETYSRLLPAAAPQMKTPASRFAGNFHRPKYHPIPQSAWANESHGLIFYNNRYHMFYQKNGNGPFFSQQNWGHLTSTNLVDWEETQVALFPQPGWESVGTWSGHLVLDNRGVPTIFYTAVDGVKAGIGSATATGDLRHWTRNTANPLIPGAPAQYPNRDFRDPYLFKEGSHWYMIVGSGLQAPQTGTVFLYKSADLNNWQLLRPLFTDQAFLNDPGIFWEMPVFWKFGSRYMLLVNKVPVPGMPARAFYYVGDFVNDSFVVQNPRSKNLELINNLLSPAVAQDQEGRTTAIGIIPDGVNGVQHYQQGWAHVFSLPRQWNMANDSLYQKPHPYLERTRGKQTIIEAVTIKPASGNYLKARGWQWELRATLEPGSAKQVGFVLGKNENNTEYTRIYYDYTLQKIVVDRSKSSLNPNTPRDIQSDDFFVPAGQPLDWHVFIDGSVVEVFINDKWAFATRIFPENANSNIVDLFANGESARASSVLLWDRGDLTIEQEEQPVGSTSAVRVWPVPATEACSFQLPANAAGQASLHIYDLSGKKVRTLQQSIGAGPQKLNWDLKSDAGMRVPGGSYYARLTTNNMEPVTIKLVVLQ